MKTTKIHRDGIVECWVCTKKMPLAFSNEHHVRPREAGGDDSRKNLKQLCASDHQNLHRLADLFLAKQSGKAKDLTIVAYSDPLQQARILQLAREAALWVNKHKMNTPVAAQEKIIKSVNVDFSLEEYKKLLTICIEFRVKTVPAMIKMLVSIELNKRFIAKEEFEEYKSKKNT